MAMAETDTGFQRSKRGPGVYDFVKDLISKEKDAKFMDENGRYWINWLTAPRLYHKFRAKKNPKLLSECDPKAARKTLYGALINSYKDDGAVEYEEFKVFRKGGQVAERQFQMPSKIFESLFASDYTSSGCVSAEGPDSDSIEETMDCEDLAVDPASSDSEDSVNPSQMNVDGGVVETICPSSGPTKGGFPILITLGRKLSRGVKSGECEFVQVGGIYPDTSIQWEKINSKTIKLIVPAAEKPGQVVLRVTTETNEFLGDAIFLYVDEQREALETLIENPKGFSENSDLMPSLFSKIVKDPSLQKLFFQTMYSQDGGMSENDSTVAENLGSTIQANYSQAFEVLLRLVYIAAEEDAHQFIKMIYSTSAGKILVGSYSNELPLPEDVAKAKGHFELAEYLHDVNKRFSNEDNNDVKSKSIDWQELIQAVDRMQTQSFESEDERDFRGMPSHEDSNLSDYLADAETSSCGSFEVDIKWAVLEDEDPREKAASSFSPSVPSDKKESSRMQSKDDDNQRVSPADAETSSCGSLELIGDWSDLEEKSGTFTKDIEPTEKEAPPLTPPVEPSSEETTQFDQAKGEEQTSFWSYRFGMFDLLGQTFLMCIFILSRILKGFMRAGDIILVSLFILLRISIAFMLTGHTVLMCISILLSILKRFMPAGDIILVFMVFIWLWILIHFFGTGHILSMCIFFGLIILRSFMLLGHTLWMFISLELMLLKEIFMHLGHTLWMIISLERMLLKQIFMLLATRYPSDKARSTSKKMKREMRISKIELPDEGFDINHWRILYQKREFNSVLV